MAEKLEHCPECGESLKGRSPRKHAISHWGEKPILKDNQNKKAIERAKMLGLDVTVIREGN